MSNLAPANSSQASVHVSRGALSLNTDGSVSQKGVQRLNTAELNETSSGDVMATARTAYGSPKLGGELKPTDIITVNGYEMQVQIAERLGLVEKDAVTGRYEATGNDSSSKPSGDEQPTAEEAGESLANPALEQDLTALIEGGATAGTQIRVLNQIIEGGEFDAMTLASAASELRIEPGDVSQRVEAIRAGFEAQAVQTVERLGSSNAQDFFNWAFEHRPNDMKEAMRMHGMQRSTKGYEPIYQHYLESYADNNPEAVLNAESSTGITARRQGNKIILSIPGEGEMEYRSALRAGLITVKGA